MGTTTSNQDLGITTKTSDHIAKTDGATDVCWNPPVKVTIPHANEVSTTKATEHTSSKTMFSGGNVVREGDAIGPPSGPAHPDNGAGGGVVSHTHLKEARIPVGSPNVKAEGKPLGRKTDKTTQNHANTVGSIQGGNPATTISEIDAAKLLACSLDTIKTVCGHGREPGPEHLLEITATDTVKFTAKRKNAKTGGAPSCTQMPHTKWVITQIKDGKQTKREEKTGDVITLANADWFTWGDLDAKATGTMTGSVGRTEAGNVAKDASNQAAIQKARTDATKAVDGMTADHHIRDNGGRTPSTADGRAAARAQATQEIGNTAAARKEAALANQQATFDAAKAAYAAGKDVYKATTSLIDFYKVWNADKGCEVTVEAFACSGGDKYTLRSYPGKEIEFAISSETLAKIKAAVQAIQKVFRGVQKIATLAGAPAKADVKLFDPIEFKMACVWEEMKADNAELKKYKHHCDRGWSFMVSAMLAKVEFTLELPVALFANLFVPGAGSALSSALNFIGFTATIGFDVTIKISVGVWGERKPGSAKPTFGGGFPLELEIFARVKIAWRTNLEVAGGIIVKGEPKLQLMVPSIDLFQSYFKLLPGEFKIGFKGVAKVNLYLWKGDWAGEYYPDSAKVTWDEVPFKIFALLKQ